MNGLFITLEGPDGAGKTSNLHVLAEVFTQAGYDVVKTREPGGSPFAEKLRSLVFETNVSGRAELLLMLAARQDHLDSVIVPALDRGAIVLCDRYIHSTLAYQGYGRHLRADINIASLHHMLGHRVPDYTLYFKISMEESMRRINARSAAGDAATRFDTEAQEFRERVYKGYSRIFDSAFTDVYGSVATEYVVRINAEQEPDKVAIEVRAIAMDIIMTRLKGWRPKQ